MKLEFLQLWRAIAVMAVVFYHYWPNLIPRGYLGVDVFFVISGYVIAKTINKYDLKLINSYLVFIKARIVRLLPTLIFVYFIVIIFTLLFASPIIVQTENLNQIIASLFGISNVYFYRKPAGYFEAPLETSWLLHSWSLSLEWQFYFTFIFMLFIANVFLISQKIYKIKFLIITIFSLSLILTIAQFYFEFHLPFLQNPVKEQIFYLPLQRIYQFLAGVILFYWNKKIGKLDREIHLNKVLKAQIIVIAIFVYLILLTPRSMAFDIYGSIIAVALISGSILIHEFRIPPLFRFLIPIGNASYSLYLWHWPILIFTKQFMGDSNYSLIFAFILTLILSTFSYQYIEKQSSVSDIVLKRVFISSTILLLICTMLLVFNKVNYNLSHVESLKNSQKVSSKFGRSCWSYPNFSSTNFQTCRYSTPDQSGWVLLVGDSHAHSLSDGIYKRFSREKLGLISYPLCDVSDNSPVCKKYLNMALKLAKSEEVKLVIFTGRISRQIKLYNRDAVISNRMAWVRNLEQNKKEWLYILDVPNIGADPCGGFGWWNSTHTCESKIKLMSKGEIQARKLEEVFAQGLTKSKVFDPWKVFCDKNKCDASKNSVKFYLDDNHLNFYGSIYLSKFIDYSG